MRSWAVLALLLLSTACDRGARRPEDAIARLRAAVAQDDAATAFMVLDRETRWSIESTWRYHQQCLDAIETAYPPDLQARERGRFIDTRGPKEFLAAYEQRYHLLRELSPRLPMLGATDFAADGYGRYGYTGLRERWEDIKQRASHDLDTCKQGADAFRAAKR
jgi:hypothetical protein